VAQPERDMETR